MSGQASQSVEKARRWICPCGGGNVPGTDQCRTCGGGR